MNRVLVEDTVVKDRTDSFLRGEYKGPGEGYVTGNNGEVEGAGLEGGS
jgi:hypothetical protein